MAYQRETVSSESLKALMAAYGRAERDHADIVTQYCGRPIPVGTTPRNQRLVWANTHLGYRVDSFTKLTPAQAGYLLDILNGQQTRLDKALEVAFTQAGIANRKAWFDSIVRERAGSKLLWRFAGHGFEFIDFRDKYNLLNILNERRKTA